jgi:3-hydroxy-9,10-secoandrosta-1,3,5(10)-triene-9,17-dione monooxygenase reductase component
MTVEQQDDPAIEPAEFRRVLGHFPTGVTVVTAKGADRLVGIAIGSFVSISLDPPLVGFFLVTESGSWPAIRDSGYFCVNVLTSEQKELCGLMASKAEDKFAGVDCTPAPVSGAPVLPGVHASIDCRIQDVVEAGDHILVVGRVLHLDTPNEHLTPMVFHKGQYGGFGS